jgi:adenylosuccinate lyase
MNDHDPNDSYRSPLESRYASADMRAIWSPNRKFRTWRRIWLALAEAQRELGLPITAAQVDELRAHLDDIDHEAAERYEAKLRHDVMAHIHALGDLAPKARAIIHLGATSQDVNDNTELILIRDSLRLIASKMARVIDALGRFAEAHRDRPTLGFTHFQPAQPTTVGKRATLWAQDFVLALEEVEFRLRTLRFRGLKGATGTQASFLALLNGDARAVDALEARFAAAMGWDGPGTGGSYPVTGQTYPRIVDAQVLNALAVAAAAIHKCCTDLRLLAHRREVDEPLEPAQVGSSAMPYKRNPMRCERATGMARFVMSLAVNGLNTAATQWLERTLDDSSNRRFSLPEAFLTLDGALDVMQVIARGLIVNERTVQANLVAELPFLASENLLMAAVQRGADRQSAHEVIRRHSQAAAQRLQREGGSSDLLERLRGEAIFRGIDVDSLLNPADFIGRAPEQVSRFIAEVIEPVRRRYPMMSNDTTDLRV